MNLKVPSLLRLAMGRAKGTDFYEAYLRSASDSEAAARLGVHDLTFGKWRRIQGLAAKGSVSLSDQSNSDRQAAYNSTNSDSEAAALINVAASAFGSWRRSRGLPSKYDVAHGRTPESRRASVGGTRIGQPRGARGPRDPQEEAARIRVYEETNNDTAAARLLKIRIGAFAAWRNSRGLPAKRTKGTTSLTGEEMEARLAAYNATTSDAEAAEMLGISGGAFHGWRRGQELPPKRGPGAPILSASGKSRNERYWKAYCSCSDDDAAAKTLGTSPLSFRRWRRRSELPTIGRPAYQALLEQARRQEAKNGAPEFD